MGVSWVGGGGGVELACFFNGIAVRKTQRGCCLKLTTG